MRTLAQLMAPDHNVTMQETFFLGMGAIWGCPVVMPSKQETAVELVIRKSCCHPLLVAMACGCCWISVPWL